MFSMLDDPQVNRDTELNQSQSRYSNDKPVNPGHGVAPCVCVSWLNPDLTW